MAWWVLLFHGAMGALGAAVPSVGRARRACGGWAGLRLLWFGGLGDGWARALWGEGHAGNSGPGLRGASRIHVRTHFPGSVEPQLKYATFKKN